MKGVNPDDPAWVATTLRAPGRLLDSSYPRRVYDSLVDDFDPWYRGGETDGFAAMLRAQHTTLVAGRDRTHVYRGASRLDDNLDAGHAALPGVFRHETYNWPNAGFSIQIRVVEELEGRLPARLGRARRDYLRAARRAGFTEPADEREFLARRLEGPHPERVPVSVAGIPRELWPYVEAYGRYIRHKYAPHHHTPTFLYSLDAHMRRIRALDAGDREPADNSLMAMLSDYLHVGVVAHPFNLGNFSLLMSQINYVLMGRGLKGIPHARLDYRALVTDHVDFRAEFFAAVERTNHE